MSNTKIKLCGMMRKEDIAAVNKLKPDFAGFVFAPGRTRTVSADQAARLRDLLRPGIKAVGVFINEPVGNVICFLKSGVIDIAQLHGDETEEYISTLRIETNSPIIKAFRIETPEDIRLAEKSGADMVLLDSGAGGTGRAFDRTLIGNFSRPYFLAGGLDPYNVAGQIISLRPYAVDVSSGIESGGIKDPKKMACFVEAVRNAY